jgi:hypothetical protein
MWLDSIVAPIHPERLHLLTTSPDGKIDVV